MYNTIIQTSYTFTNRSETRYFWKNVYVLVSIYFILIIPERPDNIITIYILLCMRISL